MKKKKTTNLKPKPKFKDMMIVLLFIIKCTLISFGGGNAVFPVIKKYAVEKNKWITIEEFNQSLITTNLLPGPSMIQALSFIAIKKLGKWGILITVLGIFPNVLLAVGVYVGLGKLPVQYFYVVNVAVISAVIAILILFCWNYFKEAKKDIKIPYIISLMVFSFAFTFFVPSPFNIPAILIVIAFVFLLTHAVIKSKKAKKDLKNQPILENSEQKNELKKD